MRLYHDVHIVIERHKEAQKALNGKLPKLTMQHLGYIGLADAEQIGGLDLFQATSFCASNPQQMFGPALAGILDLRTGQVEYADAGHEPPFIVQPSGAVLKVEKVGGIVLGFMPGQEFTSGTMRLNPGDTLVLYTDGVTEAMNVDHELFGAEAIEKNLMT